MSQTQIDNNKFTHSFYAVQGADGKFFAGFNAQEGKPSHSEGPLRAKWFSNRFEIPLRPTETLVEIKVDPEAGVVSVSEPFRPRKRTNAKVTNQAK